MKISAATPQDIIHRLYDKDFEFIELAERKSTQAFAVLILDAITKAGDWISGPQIRRQIDPNGENTRIWTAALALLCEQVETKGELIPKFRLHTMRDVKPYSRQFSLATKPHVEPYRENIYQEKKI